MHAKGTKSALLLEGGGRLKVGQRSTGGKLLTQSESSRMEARVSLLPGPRVGPSPAAPCPEVWEPAVPPKAPRAGAERVLQKLGHKDENSAPSNLLPGQHHADLDWILRAELGE